MPSEKKILTFVVEDDLLKRLEDFRFENRITSMSEAIRRLIEEALTKYEGRQKK